MNLIKITIALFFLLSIFFIRCLSDQSGASLLALDTKMLKKVYPFKMVKKKA